MENGKIIEENTTDELFKNPKHSMTRSFIKNLGSNNSETEVLAKDFDNPIYRLAYLDSNYKEAVLSQCIKKFDVDINLIAGNINRIKDKAVGYLIVEFIGNDTDNAIEYLRSLNVSVEEVKNEWNC